MEAEAPVILAHWVYYGAVMILFGSSLFPLYALVGRDPTPAMLPRAANITLALAALIAGKIITDEIWLQPLSRSQKATELCLHEAIAHNWKLSVQIHQFL